MKNIKTNFLLLFLLLFNIGNVWSADLLVDTESFMHKGGRVVYVSGKRESRRLLGDYILKEDDMHRYVVHEDGGAASTWSIDLHYPDPENTKKSPGKNSNP